jgi:hypothetical protein
MNTRRINSKKYYINSDWILSIDLYYSHETLVDHNFNIKNKSFSIFQKFLIFLKGNNRILPKGECSISYNCFFIII